MDPHVMALSGDCADIIDDGLGSKREANTPFYTILLISMAIAWN
jgi:hypothetical protein